MKTLRIDCSGFDGVRPVSTMTGIQITFDDGETDFHNAKAKALGIIVEELCRYGLHEALNGIGILDDNAKRAEKHQCTNCGKPSPTLLCTACLVTRASRRRIR